MLAPKLQLIHYLNVQPRSVNFEGPTVIKLCGFDLKTPTLTERVSALFVFPGHLSADGLRLSLSRLLEKYPVVCGRLEKGENGFELVCNSAGVPFYEMSQISEIDVSDCQLSLQAPHYAQDIEPKRLLQGREALFKVKVTYCGNNQTVLGITMAHVMSDIGGLVFLLKEWVMLHNGQKPFQKPIVLPKPIFDRDHVHPNKQNGASPSDIPLRHGVHLRRLFSLCLVFLSLLWQFFWQGAFKSFAPTTLVIPLGTLQRLKNRTNKLTLAGPNRLSSNDLLCSLLWHVVCIVRHRSEVETGTFFFPMDLRQMHVPDDYFGNAQCIQAVCDPTKNLVDTSDIDMETTADNVALTARLIRKTVIDARVPAFSAQQAASQLGQAGQPLVRRLHNKLSLIATYDACLSSWQDLYRSVSWLDFGTGLATGITALQRDEDCQPWAGWWGQNPLSGQTVLYVNVPPGKQAEFKQCPLWDLFLPGSYFA